VDRRIEAADRPPERVVKKPLLAGDVAAQLRVSARRVHQLEHVLQPVRTPGGTRVYSAERVDELCGYRAARKAVR
jgi:DNA-binding transcriptional MerR regulator